MAAVVLPDRDWYTIADVQRATGTNPHAVRAILLMSGLEFVRPHGRVFLMPRATARQVAAECLAQRRRLGSAAAAAPEVPAESCRA